MTFWAKESYILVANAKSNRRAFSGVSSEANNRMTLAMIIETVKYSTDEWTEDPLFQEDARKVYMVLQCLF